MLGLNKGSPQDFQNVKSVGNPFLTDTQGHSYPRGNSYRYQKSISNGTQNIPERHIPLGSDRFWIIRTREAQLFKRGRCTCSTCDKRCLSSVKSWRVQLREAQHGSGLWTGGWSWVGKRTCMSSCLQLYDGTSFTASFPGPRAAS